MAYFFVPIIVLAMSFGIGYVITIYVHWLIGYTFACIPPVILFQKRNLRLKLNYGNTTIRNATHVSVLGVQGNVEIISMKKEHVNSPTKDTFMYRFIKFEYDFNE
jgi:hypothetical protein